MRAVTIAILGLALLLAVFLEPSAGDHPTISATPVDFEMDVLSGLRSTQRISDGWHRFRSSATTPPPGFTDALALDFAHVDSRAETTGMPVDAVFRHVRGPAMTAVIDSSVNREHLGCKGLIVSLKTQSGDVAQIQYYHLDVPAALNPTAIDYSWDLATGGATTTSFDGMRNETSGEVLRRQHLGTLLEKDPGAIHRALICTSVSSRRPG